MKGSKKVWALSSANRPLPTEHELGTYDFFRYAFELLKEILVHKRASEAGGVPENSLLAESR